MALSPAYRSRFPKYRQNKHPLSQVSPDKQAVDHPAYQRRFGRHPYPMASCGAWICDGVVEEIILEVAARSAVSCRNALVLAGKARADEVFVCKSVAGIG